MEKKVEHEMDTGRVQGYLLGFTVIRVIVIVVGGLYWGQLFFGKLPREVSDLRFGFYGLRLWILGFKVLGFNFMVLGFKAWALEVLIRASVPKRYQRASKKPSTFKCAHAQTIMRTLCKGIRGTNKVAEQKQ